MRPTACQRWVAVSDARAIGVGVDADDVEFARAHETACPGCGAESAVWRSMAATESGAPDESGQRLAHLVLEALDEPTTVDRVLEEVERTSHTRLRRPRWPVRRIAAAAAVLAASMAAGVALELRLRPAPSPIAARPVTASPAPTAPPAATQESARSPLVLDADGPEGAGVRCETLSADLTVCATVGARYAAQEMVAARRVLDLSEGRLVVALGPQRKGASLVVATPFGRVSATDTVFSVEASTGGAWARIERGKARVTRTAAKDTRVLHAGQAMRLDDVSRPTALSEAERARDLQALTMEVADSEPPPSPQPRSARGVRAAEAAHLDPGAAGDESAGGLLARARGLLGRGDFAAAARAYERAYAAAPSSAEGGAALVALGDLQLSELGDPRGALAAFDAYLARGGGVLAPEAAFGRVGALRALGRRDEERDAARAFLREHPSGPEADAVRRHLEN